MRLVEVDAVVTPEDLGLSLAKVEDLQGGDATVNAKILEDILMAKDKGPKRDMVVLNSAAGLAGAGLADDLLKGIDLARELIDSGEALNRLRLLQDAAS